MSQPFSLFTFVFFSVSCPSRISRYYHRINLFYGYNMSVSDNINDITYYNVVGSKVFGVRVVVG